VHVVNGGGFGGGDRLVEGGYVVVIRLGVVGVTVFFHEPPQIRVGTGGVVALGHLRYRMPGEESGLKVGGFAFGHNNLYHPVEPGFGNGQIFAANLNRLAPLV
jgi:hypothetical protein